VASNYYSSPLLQQLRRKSLGGHKAVGAGATELTKALEQMLASGRQDRALKERIRQGRAQEALMQAKLYGEELDLGIKADPSAARQAGSGPVAAIPVAEDVFAQRTGRESARVQELEEARKAYELSGGPGSVEETKQRLAKRLGGLAKERAPDREWDVASGETLEQFQRAKEAGEELRKREAGFIERAEGGLGKLLPEPSPVERAVVALERGAAPNVHTVVKDDRAINIAAAHGITIQQLAELNPHIADLGVIEVGQEINLPKDEAAGVVDADLASAPGEAVRADPTLADPGLSAEELADKIELLSIEGAIVSPLQKHLGHRDPRYLPRIEAVEFAISLAKNGDMSAISRLAGRRVTRREIRRGEVDLDALSSDYRAYASGIRADAKGIYKGRLDEQALARREAVKGWETTAKSLIMAQEKMGLSPIEIEEAVETMADVYANDKQSGNALLQSFLRMGANNQRIFLEQQKINDRKRRSRGGGGGGGRGGAKSGSPYAIWGKNPLEQMNKELGRLRDDHKDAQKLESEASHTRERVMKGIEIKDAAGNNITEQMANEAWAYAQATVQEISREIAWTKSEKQGFLAEYRGLMQPTEIMRRTLDFNENKAFEKKLDTAYALGGEEGKKAVESAWSLYDGALTKDGVTDPHQRSILINQFKDSYRADKTSRDTTKKKEDRDVAARRTQEEMEAAESAGDLGYIGSSRSSPEDEKRIGGLALVGGVSRRLWKGSVPKKGDEGVTTWVVKGHGLGRPSRDPASGYRGRSRDRGSSAVFDGRHFFFKNQHNKWVRVTKKDLKEKGYRTEATGVKRTEEQYDPDTYKKVEPGVASADDWKGLDWSSENEVIKKRGTPPGWVYLLEPGEQRYWSSTASPIFTTGKADMGYWVGKAPFDKNLFIKKRNHISEIIGKRWEVLSKETMPRSFGIKHGNKAEFMWLDRIEKDPEIVEMTNALRTFENYYRRAFGEKIPSRREAR
jgi:LysM repeat protein